LTIEENAGMPAIYRFVMDYEYQEKKEGNLLAEIYSLFINYLLCIGFHKNFLSVNTNSGVVTNQYNKNSMLWIP
jgi:hypothetical protein